MNNPPMDFNTGVGGYIPKQLFLEPNKTQQSMLAGIGKLSIAVGSTLGPKGRTVLIESRTHVGGVTSTKDGVTVAKSISVTDPLENLAIHVVKESASKTASEAGDGTTTSIIVAEEIIRAGMSAMHTDHNITRVLRFMSDIFVDEVIPMLDKATMPCTKDNLHSIATISANNDSRIGGLIEEAYKKVGVDKDSIITVAKSEKADTYVETHDGFKLEQGWYSPFFRTSEKRDECLLEDCYVFVSNMEINNFSQITAILEFAVQEKKPLLFVSPMTQEIVGLLVRNVLQHKLKWCAIDAPALGWKRDDIMSDLAMSTGATYFNDKTGDDLTNATHLNLGFAKKIIVTPSTTVIQRDEVDEIYGEDIAERVSELKLQLENTEKKPMATHLRKRIASLSGSIGQIYVGGDTANEQKERFDRVDDAVCAVRSALEEGVIPGGGIVPLAISDAMLEKEVECEDIDKVLAYGILRRGLCRPFVQIMHNAGLNPDDIISEISGKNEDNSRYGYDLMNNKYGDMIEMGVIDPTKVAKEAIRNAISVASTILNTSVVITQERALS